MTKLKDLQHEVHTKLYGATSLGKSGGAGGIPVVEHVGSDANETAVADALQNKGVVLVASIPFNGKLASQATGTVGKAGALLDVEISVLVRVDVNRNTVSENASALAANVFQVIGDVVSTLLGSTTVNPNDAYKLAPDALNLDTYDAGIWGYEICFIKRCML